jgi:hypothetical protein
LLKIFVSARKSGRKNRVVRIVLLWHNPRDSGQGREAAAFFLNSRPARWGEATIMITRVGDVVDDYCSRCRLLTNHTVMAMVGEEVRKVICRTCDFTHDYKHAKGAEKKTKPSAKQSAFDEVLASVLAGKNLETGPKPANTARQSRSLGRGKLRARAAPPSRHPSRTR